SLPLPVSTLFPYTTLFRSRRACARLPRPSSTRRRLLGIRAWRRDRNPPPTRRRGCRRRTRLRPSSLGVALGRSRSPVLVGTRFRSEEHTSELQSRFDLVCR